MNGTRIANEAIHPEAYFNCLPNNEVIKKPKSGNSGISIAGLIRFISFNIFSVILISLWLLALAFFYYSIKNLKLTRLEII